MQYQLIRSKRRKTIALQVKQGEVIVRAPEYVNISVVKQLINDKQLWLKEKVSHQKQQLALVKQEQTLPFSEKPIYIDGIEHKIEITISDDELAKSYIEHNLTATTLDIHFSKKYQCVDNEDSFMQAIIQQEVERWFIESTSAYLYQSLRKYSELMALTPTSYRVRKYKSRWGSCNSQGKLTFNSLLKMVPLWVKNYVVVHELCHLKHLDHSPQFWALVAKYYPEYHQAKQWLKQHQQQLVVGG